MAVLPRCQLCQKTAAPVLGTTVRCCRSCARRVGVVLKTASPEDLLRVWGVAPRPGPGASAWAERHLAAVAREARPASVDPEVIREQVRAILEQPGAAAAALVDLAAAYLEMDLPDDALFSAAHALLADGDEETAGRALDLVFHARLFAPARLAALRSLVFPD